MHFSAPECLCNIKYDAPKADIWSLGIILYYLIVGKTPWTSNDRNIMMKQIVSGYVFIPEYLIRSEIDLLRQILKVNPTERISTESILFHPFMTIRRSSTQIRPKSKTPISLPSIRSSHKIFSPSVKQYTFE
ncbi:serine/threonine-protein kinase, putative [Trichomonas vaginalis G3]|uniref:Serine/threonine-protein kinase, putative n=1 Tax=Trichomonas vaginalis (strain ATCC PRA-98 / G3) TaxID=412133 RepID=A2DCU1_TRIV3|nr:protein serine/threonine kinase protein [Trichomonas vaginalis G3]EAY21715.1 serine/threonine-protein kinase, putative [Trichomonas vaginalis G3]KAI5496240.1 protein serine/threonine kinase protein [Trichomonas vaginalis G3]|eukprot:XP_001582701.1 serine/threonine-protein kinase [Trichomonas vaginalis G3]